MLSTLTATVQQVQLQLEVGMRPEVVIHWRIRSLLVATGAVAADDNVGSRVHPKSI